MGSGVPTRDVDTPHGRAVVHLDLLPEPAGALVLGHGAGGGVTAPDLVAATRAARDEGFSVVLVEQPYRVAGRRSPPRAALLDVAWTAVMADLASGELRGLRVVTGGRSSGARVACRTAAATGAAGVLCLAFPLQPPRRAGTTPAPSREDELDRAGVDVLVVQGDRDPFGMPSPGPHRRVVPIAGDHRLRSDPGALATAVGDWLRAVV